MAIGAGCLVAGAVAGGLFLRRLTTRPRFVAGEVRARPLRSAEPVIGSDGKLQGFGLEDGTRLFGFEQGEGSPVVVVHGGPGIAWERPIDALGGLKGLRFVYYDQRGCGRSTRPLGELAGRNPFAKMRLVERALGLGTQLADLEQLRMALGTGQIRLIGHSFGALLAAMYAAEFPEHVRALVLVSPPDALVLPPRGGGVFERIAEVLPPSRREAYLAFRKQALDPKTILSRTEGELAGLQCEFARYYAEAAEACGFAAPVRCAEELAGGWMMVAQSLSMGRIHDWRPRLAGVEAPALVLHGERDLVAQSVSEQYAAALPHARLAVLPGAGHYPFLDCPGRFREEVREFLDRVG